MDCALSREACSHPAGQVPNHEWSRVERSPCDEGLPCERRLPCRHLTSIETRHRMRYRQGFQAQYGLKVNSVQPDASSADEITAAKNLKGQSKAPDVFDLGGAVANVNTTQFAPSKVATFNDVSKGVDFFPALKTAGNFLTVDPTGATIESGQTPVVFDWDYPNVAQGKKLKGKMDWKTFIPAGAVVGGYDVQAISKDAPHPAAARPWQEYLYSDGARTCGSRAAHGRCAKRPWSRRARSTRPPMLHFPRPRAHRCS
jgi:ABC-type Fe3+ transport system substrate-binding protein